jgi:YbbR domain-containing protein
MVMRQLTNLRKRLGPGILARALFSLALAILLWGWVTNQDDPVVDQPFSGITPTITGKAPDLVLDETRIPTITVTVRGPRSDVNRLNPLDLQVTLDLSGIKDPGSTSIEVSATVTGHHSARVLSVTPATVAISTDRVVAKTFPLEVEKGAPIPPYSIGNVTPAVQQVEVRGRASLVDQVARVVLPVNLGDRRDNFEAQFAPEPRDSSGARVNGLTIDPGSVSATVTVERIGRTVSIVPNIQGTPADGYRVGNPRVSPPSVTVDGPAEVLAQLIVISTVPIDVGGKSEAFSVFNVALNLPAGTRVIDRNPVNVEIPIDAEQQRQQVGVFRVTPVNIGAGLRIVPGGGITPSEISVTVSGPLASIRQLSANDIQVQVDLSGKDVGTYNLTPTVLAPTDLKVDPPQTVRVQIERIPATPTITPTPRPTPTPTPAPPPTPAPTPAPSGRRAAVGI